MGGGRGMTRLEMVNTLYSCWGGTKGVFRAGGPERQFAHGFPFEAINHSLWRQVRAALAARLLDRVASIAFVVPSSWCQLFGVAMF
ncbi:hypothetical protein D5086_024422 [Populus alba]|uniref:Uncharacterized protein n=1 Tax=Populus alba TaxID=43335 RepID=A0ACC4B5D8_POPAL